jgi:hypothetical protein
MISRLPEADACSSSSKGGLMISAAQPGKLGDGGGVQRAPGARVAAQNEVASGSLDGTKRLPTREALADGGLPRSMDACDQIGLDAGVSEKHSTVLAGFDEGPANRPCRIEGASVVDNLNRCSVRRIDVSVQVHGSSRPDNFTPFIHVDTTAVPTLSDCTYEWHEQADGRGRERCADCMPASSQALPPFSGWRVEYAQPGA